MNAETYRIEKDGKFIDEYSYQTFEQACWTWNETPDTQVVELNIATGERRRCTSQECQDQLRRSPAPSCR